MATRLLSVINFGPLAALVNATLPHQLNVNDIGVIPDLVAVAGATNTISITATDTDITVTNSGPAAAPAFKVLCWHLHSIGRVLGGIPSLSVQPFLISGGEEILVGPNATPSVPFVYQPGGTASANVYTDWALLMTAIGLVEGLRIIQIDDTYVSPAVIPAGTWDLTGVVLRGLLFRPVYVQINEGVTFIGARQFDGNLIMTFVGTTPPIQDMANGQLLIAERGVIFSSTLGPFIRLSALTAGESVTIVLRDGSGFQNAGAPVLDVPVVGTGGAVVALGAFSEIASNTISGVVGAQLTLGGTVNVPFGFVSVDQPAFLGALQFVAVPGRYNITGTAATSDVTANVGDVTRVDPTGGAFNVTLPAAFNNSGQPVIVKNVSASANVVTILPTGADTIDGAASQMIAAARGALTFVSDGVSDWMIVASI